MEIRLENISLTHVRIPLREPFVISNGSVSEKDAILIELTGEGGVGLGEASPMAGAFYSAQTPDSTRRVLKEQLAAQLARCEHVRLDGKWVEGFDQDPFAVNGIDTALWDLMARRREQPLWKMIGGLSRPIESGLAVGIYADTQTLIARIEEHLQLGGYRRIKIKIQPGWDEMPLKMVRRNWPDMPLMVDANCSYSRDHIAHLANLDRFNLMMIEQPLAREDLEGHAMLARACATPICLDESAETPAMVERAIQMRAASIINIKLQRLGTLSAALRVHKLAADAGVGCWMGTMPELAVGGYAAMHFATLPNMKYPTDVEASDRWFVADVTVPSIICRDGLLTLPQESGLGVRLDRAAVARFKIREWSSKLACTLVHDAPLDSASSGITENHRSNGTHT